MPFVGDCDVCGAVGIAKYTARFTPIGETWVGSKEAYKTCCEPCFYATCYFTNPIALLDNPTFYSEHKKEILTTTELAEDEFGEAVGAAVVAMESGNHPRVIYCPCSKL